MQISIKVIKKCLFALQKNFEKILLGVASSSEVLSLHFLFWFFRELLLWFLIIFIAGLTFCRV